MYCKIDYYICKLQNLPIQSRFGDCFEVGRETQSEPPRLTSSTSKLVRATDVTKRNKL